MSEIKYGFTRRRVRGGEGHVPRSVSYLLLLSSAGLILKMSSSFLPLFSGLGLRKFSRFLCR